MDESSSFKCLIHRARVGDTKAAARMIERYEPALRREVRMLHTDPHLKRALDTSDLVQSVLGNFFIRLAAGQFDLEHPEQLVKLLSKMARNKILNYLRSDRPAAEMSSISALAGDVECPSEIVSRKDLLEKVHALLSEEERVIADKRTRGSTWEEVADELGGSAEALRKQYIRALNRVARAFDLDELDI